MWQKVAKFKGAEYFRKALYHGFQPIRIQGSNHTVCNYCYVI